MRWPEGDSVSVGPPGVTGPGVRFMCAKRDTLSLRLRDHLTAPVSLPALRPLQATATVTELAQHIGPW